LVFPNLITHVATTDAMVTGNQMTGAVHDGLTAKSLTRDGSSRRLAPVAAARLLPACRRS